MSKKRKNKQKTWQVIFEIVIIIFVLIGGYITSDIKNLNNDIENVTQKESIIIDLSTIPEYTSSPYVELNNNIPYFTEEDYNTKAFEKYSEWDNLGRKGVHFNVYCYNVQPGIIIDYATGDSHVEE